MIKEETKQVIVTKTTAKTTTTTTTTTIVTLGHAFPDMNFVPSWPPVRSR